MEKIKAKEKLSFVLLNAGNIPVTLLVNSFLLVFYTDVVGLSATACASRCGVRSSGCGVRGAQRLSLRASVHNRNFQKCFAQLMECKIRYS